MHIKFNEFFLKIMIAVGFVYSGEYFHDNFWIMFVVYFCGYVLMDLWSDLKNKNN